MKTFFNILQTLVKVKNKFYPNEPFNPENNMGDDPTCYDGTKECILFLMNHIFYITKKIDHESIFLKNAFAKFTSLNSFLLNTFYRKEFKETILNIFSTSQKHYYAFSRLARIYKLKKHPYIVTHDLMMNSLDPNNKLTFILVEEKSNFLFNMNELINIIETAIGNSPNFFSEPLSPLNPYNNQEFTLATLYNIYFQMKKQRRVMPLLFHCFFLEHFNKIAFSEEHEPIIREQAIKKYIFNSPHTILYSQVISMLKHNPYTQNLSIHKNFPKNLLVNIFRPFLFYDYISNYYIKGTLKAYNARQLLYNKLRLFYKYNKSFGREMIKLTKQNNKIVKQEYIINTNHLSFYNIPVIDQQNTFVTTNTEYATNNHSSTNPFATNNHYDNTIATIASDNVVDIIIILHNETLVEQEEQNITDDGYEDLDEYSHREEDSDSDGEENSEENISEENSVSSYS